MSIGTFVIAGLIIGFLVSKLIIRSGDGLLRDLGLGVAGAVLAGVIAGAVRTAPSGGLDVFGLVITAAGASAALVVFHVLFPNFRP